MVGAIVLCLGLLRLGYLDSILSHTVVSSLIFGVAISVIVSQLSHLFGMTIPAKHNDGVIDQLSYFFSNVGQEANEASIVFSICTISFLVMVCVCEHPSFPPTITAGHGWV
jgi:SulP family sulfate permease